MRDPPRYEVLAGRAWERGFLLYLRGGEEEVRALVERGKGVRVERGPAGPHAPLPLSLGTFRLPPLSLLLLGLLVALAFRERLPDLALFPPLFLPFASLVARATGVGRWHALEHKAIHLLREGDLPGDRREALARLRAASPLLEECGSLLLLRFFLLLSPLALLLPAGAALSLAFLLAHELHASRTGARLLLPLQWLFLATPREEEEALALSLLEALKEAR